MTPHRLDPLLRPRSIAVVGASARAGSPGNEVLVNLRKGGFSGELYAVNPGRDKVLGIPCYPGLSALPQVPQQVVFAVSDARLEACVDEAIALGVEAVTIFSAMLVPQDSAPGLQQRIRDKANAAGLLLHGGNCMGFFNFHDRVWMSGFDTRAHDHPGHVVLLSQSGAGMSGILDCEERLDFLFAASTGQELCVAFEDYLDYVLDLPQTRVVGLFLETSRHPRKFMAALEKARQRRIPIVAIKVGKTELAATLALSHSGALSGSDATYAAVFERYGVQRVDDMAQLAAALILFSQAHPLPPGGLATLHDSGGERQLAVDLAEELGLVYPGLSGSTEQSLRQLLDEGLPAVNPLDAWGSGGADAAVAMQACFSTLMKDPEVALGAVVHDRAPGGGIYSSYLSYLRAAHAATGKPVCLVANHPGSGSDPLAVAATREGFPVLDGLREFLVAARSVLAYRDFLARGETQALRPLPPARVEHWRRILGTGGALSEVEAGNMLRDFGIDILPGTEFEGPAVPPQLLQDCRFPVVLKTARAGLRHKSDVGGVVLDLATPRALLAACQDMVARLGPALMLAPMVPGEGVEMILGVSRDPQFGPTVLLGFGGVHAEIMRDVVVLLPPFSPQQARRGLDRLQLRSLLGEVRGRGPLPLQSFCEMASRLSVLAIELADCIVEVDINPVKLQVDTCVGVDALVLANKDLNS